MHRWGLEEKGFLPHITVCCLDRIGGTSAFQGRILEKQNHNCFVCCLHKKSWSSAFVTVELLLASVCHL